MAEKVARDYSSFPQTQQLVELNFYNTSKERIKEAYKKEATLYDKQTTQGKFVGHIHVADAFSQYAPELFGNNCQKEELRILDVGAGTGLVAECLHEHCYTNIDALDISQDMLDMAREKKLYHKLICFPADEAVQHVGSGQYDAIVSSAVITPGQIQPSHLDNIIKLVKVGGMFCVNVRFDAMNTEEYGYKKKFEELVSQGVLELISQELKDYFKCGNAEQFSHPKCYVLVYKVLKHNS